MRGLSFHPRSRTGSDPSGTVPFNAAIMFQSTPPHGGRPLRRLAQAFNTDWLFPVSIHAPARGATASESLAENLTSGDRLCFNPRPRTGGDTGMRLHDDQLMVADSFQSTPPHGGDSNPTVRLNAVADRGSIHAPCVGGDHEHPVAERGALYRFRRFNPRPRTWGTT